MPNSQLTSHNFMQPQLELKRSINIKVVVTPRWKEEAQQQLQAQINQIDSQLQQLEMQGQRMVSEIQKQNLQPPGTFTVGLGENLIQKMQVEVLLRDGIVEEIRGDI